MIDGQYSTGGFVSEDVVVVDSSSHPEATGQLQRVVSVEGEGDAWIGVASATSYTASHELDGDMTESTV